MKKTIFNLFAVTAVVVAAFTLGSCGNKKFRIDGQISGADGSMLYLENLSLDGPVAVDSVKLGAEGTFEFTGDASQAPEFYRLRIEGDIVNISIDSTETVSIKASMPGMAANYTVEGSENCAVIKELAMKQMALQTQIIAIQNNAMLGLDATRDSIMKIIDAYKNDVKMNYIFKDPMKSSSYFALFQTIGNSLIFNPRQNEDDIKVFAAVATSWDVYHPDAVRGKNLHNITIEGMKNIRIVQNKMAKQGIDPSRITVSNIIDVTLLDNKGKARSLTDLKGSVVLLDFHVFGTKESTKRIMKLREIYNKYHDRGLEIYQVSLDPDEHFWKTQTAALPWISVRDPQGLNSRNLSSYNVQSLPTFFLVDRSNVLYKRDAQIQDLDAEIQKLL
ncbi:redoxin domain-containing protein [Prevotella sp. PCHR]|uniref:Redoxin domain-containing protein n=1 Tax=Xylanibacter caecicola TaxID=2736294 RepID=A0ABX2AXY1_9BACT|nr:thioredoxin-like domain-containing protein [Xylanibacter caecicola]NPE23996.1 redoxin domain-containing protein [Xylanibacter caecicola]